MFLDYSFSQLFDEPLLMDVFHITSDPSSSVVDSLYVWMTVVEILENVWKSKYRNL